MFIESGTGTASEHQLSVGTAHSHELIVRSLFHLRARARVCVPKRGRPQPQAHPHRSNQLNQTRLDSTVRHSVTGARLGCIKSRTTLPCSITTILSAFCIVDSLWAITMVVHPFLPAVRPPHPRYKRSTTVSRCASPRGQLHVHCAQAAAAQPPLVKRSRVHFVRFIRHQYCMLCSTGATVATIECAHTAQRSARSLCVYARS